MAGSVNIQLGAGSSPSQKVKKIGTVTGITGTYVQLENDVNACGVLVIHDSGSGTGLFVCVSDSAPANDLNSVDVGLTGAIYLHNVYPARVWVKRSTGASSITAKYITYV